VSPGDLDADSPLNLLTRMTRLVQLQNISDRSCRSKMSILAPVPSLKAQYRQRNGTAKKFAFAVAPTVGDLKILLLIDVRSIRKPLQEFRPGIHSIGDLYFRCIAVARLANNSRASSSRCRLPSLLGSRARPTRVDKPAGKSARSVVFTEAGFFAFTRLTGAG
jgi:hypothetical protein